MRALIVDDLHLNHLILGRMLKAANCDYDSLMDGHDLIHTKNLNRYDLIFLDEQMPILTGSEAVKIIRQNNLYFGRITSFSNLNYRWTQSELEKMGYDGKVHKPCTFEEIQQLLDTIRLSA